MIIALQTLIFFRQSLFTVIERFLRPYYRKLSLKFKGDDSDDDAESDDHVFAEYDDEKGVVFYPPVYAQRYAAVTDCLMDERWCGSLEKVVDFGYHDMSFIKYLKDVPGIKHILCVDIETIPMKCSSDLLGCENFATKRETPLQVTLFQGNAADPDYRLIGCDAIIAIEMIEHMLPHDLERLIHTVFGFIKPRVAIFTTPNGNFNILFNALEKNGLRRLDHFFEWSREQFHDWCSNIVTRYPQYTVTCKGIGPGPTGTLHLGCCSQLALFVNKEYRKQPDLNPNSLALVAKGPSTNNLSDMIGSWESPDTVVESNMLCIPNSVESYAESIECQFDQQSCMTIVIPSPTFSLEAMGYQDKILQCNLDSELGKNFLMFDDDMFFNVLKPSRKKYFRVYEFEDVASRLNCSTLQVKKFSKLTQNLMAKNKIDSLAHTREVVDEIRHLTKMLNFNKEHRNRDFEGIWLNINWGDNAPYWNQYYKIVKEYCYPFEVKTDDCRILELISEEINRRIDTEYGEEFAVDMHKLEIPIDHLMPVVEHITKDVHKVKELLEWNGYEIIENVVIHSRLLVDNISEGTQDEDWHDDTISDWNTVAVHSTSLSDGSTIAPDYYGHFMRRALDRKVRKLRTLLTADEDIASELDHVMCRLMKLALRTSKCRQSPPTLTWMQCKLFDLLTLTEKAIERQGRMLLESYSLKAIEYREKITNNLMEILCCDEIEDKGDSQKNYDADSEFDDFITVTSNEFEAHDNNNTEEQLLNNAKISNTDIANEVYNIEVQKAHESTNLISYPKYSQKSAIIGSDESTYIIFEDNKYISDIKYTLKNDANFQIRKNDRVLRKNRSNSKRQNKHIIHKLSRTKKFRQVSSTRSNYLKLVKYEYSYNKKYVFSKRKKSEGHQNLQFTPSRPIPASLIELCHSQSNIGKNLMKFNSALPDSTKNELNDSIGATEECMFIGIITEDGEETIAMRRHIGTTSEISLDNEDLLETVINITKDHSFQCEPSAKLENVPSQTVFLYDLNEPSTSRGVRHLNTDVQCGPDTIATCANLSAATSFTKMPKKLAAGVKIGESNTNIKSHKNIYDFDTPTELSQNIVRVCRKSAGIKIKNSNSYIHDKTECFTMTHESEDKDFRLSTEPSNFDSRTETKPVSSALKIDDSGSKFCGSVESYSKSPSQFNTSKNASDFQIQSVSNEKNVVAKISQASYDRPKLVCGGIHVHSFKERQESEDVVYQGEWQRKQNFLQRNVRSPIESKHISASKKKRIVSKEYGKVNEKQGFSKKPTPVTKLRIKKTEPSNKSIQIKGYESSPFRKIKKNVVKIATKVPVRNMKSIYTPKKHANLNNKEAAIKKESDNQHMSKVKNYLPLYLRRKRERSVIRNDNKNDKLNTTFENIHTKYLVPPMKTTEITKDLMKIPRKTLINNINYTIFRNEIDTKKDSNNIQSSPTIGINKNGSINRNHSPQSEQSSTCSSPNSIATVCAVSTRNRVICNRKNSTSSEKSSSGIFESENKSTKNIKNSRRGKGNKKSQVLETVLCDNKENVPESSKNVMFSNKDLESTPKSAFLDPTKSFMAQTTTDPTSLPLTSVTISKTKMQNVTKTFKFMNINNTDDSEVHSSSVIDAATLQKNSTQDCFDTKYIRVNPSSYVPDDKVFIYDTFKERCSNSSLESDTFRIPNESDDELSSGRQSVHNTKSSIISAIRKLIENKLNHRENYSDSNNSDSETVIFDREGTYVNGCINSLSPSSIHSIIRNEDLCIPLVANDNEAVPICGGIKSPDKESDSLSLKSFTSMSTSKFSEYYLADNELENTLPEIDALDISSIQEIFERKKPNIIPNIGGVLAVQAFSGFSVNEPLAVDQSDYINFLDSETGSFAFVSARQAASEEIFVSGRSSDTYASCCFDDDAYVPNWLFNVISQQQSTDESEADEINQPLPMPITQPDFDMNGNVMEPGIRASAGAGDGRGIHSDQSQDSSGRGTSVSSSETSSEQQSETVSIDPSTFTDQANFLREPGDMSAMNFPPNRTYASPVTISADHHGEDTSNHHSRNARNSMNPVIIVSDIDADVSSLGSDAVGSCN